MSQPGIEWEASTLEKSHLDSLFAGYSEPLIGLRLAQRVASTWLPPVHAGAWTCLGVAE
jgi:hypothetical protein